MQVNGLKRIFYSTDDHPSARWLFSPGMLFGSKEKWWGNGSERARPHEGIDLIACVSEGGNIFMVDGNTEIPVIQGGRIISVVEDFLGFSIFQAHDIFDSSRRRLCTAYGHTEPLKDVSASMMVGRGDVIAKVSQSGNRQSIVPAHLHITTAWIPDQMLDEGLDWGMFNSSEDVAMINPLDFIISSYVIM